MKRNPSLSFTFLVTPILAFAAAAQFGQFLVSPPQTKASPQQTTARQTIPKHYDDFDIRADHQRSLAVIPATVANRHSVWASLAVRAVVEATP